MKHKLLSLLALAGAMCMSTGAMAWDYPTMPAALEAPATYDGTWATPTADGQYYIYNVGTGLFLGGGQTWGTRGIALCDSVVLTSQEPVTINNTSGNTTANYVLPFELISGSNEGEWYLNVLNNSKATGGAGHFVGEDGAQAWIDGDEGRNTSYGTWTMEATEEGYLIKNYYASQSKYTDAPVAFGIDGNNIQAGWAFTWTDLLVTPDASTKTRPYLVWKFVDASNGEAVRTYCQSYAKAVASEEYQAKLTAYKAAIAAFNAKFDLKVALEEADEAGVSTDAAAAVYNNADATEEEVKAATETLKAAIVSSQYDFSGASEDNPLDITDQVLENPDFERNYVRWQLPESWEITITAQNKCGQESAGEVNEEKGYVHIEHFIEAWNGSALGDGDIRQTVYGLPSGKYVLECDAFTGQGTKTFEGVYIFIEHASGVVTTPINTPDGQPMHFAVTFVNPDPASTFLRFGLRVKGTNANWIGADNFKLYYYGESTETQESLSLKDAIKKGNEANGEGANSDIDNSSSNNFSKEARATLTNAIANGESALSGTAEEMTAATEAIYNAIEALKTSMATYAQYQAIYADANLKLDEIPSKWSSLTSAIEDWMDAMAEGFSAGTLNEETLATDKNQLAIIIREALANGLEVEAGDDLTFLLINPGFTQGTTTDPTGWTINSGSMTELRDATDNIETFHKAFDLSQTLPNMPAGVYDVTLQGFARHDDGTVTDKTWLYGGISKEFLISLNDDEEQMRTDPIFCEANIAEYPALGDTFYDNTASNGMYKANGMTGAYYWFRTENPNTGENYYVNHVKVVLDKDGDLKIGIHCETTKDWVIFSNFGIKYTGMDVTIFAQMVEKKKAELKTLYEATDELSIATDVLAEVSTMLEFDAGNIDNADDALAKIAEIDEVIAALKESTATYTELGKVLEYFENILVTVNATEKFNTLVSDARQNYDSGYATLAAMKADQKAMTDGWSAAVGGNLQAGDDATVAILNPHYDGLVADDGVSGVDFWTSEGAPGYDFLECEFFNKTFNHYQTLTGLTPGYYTLSLDGFYRYGTYNADTELGTPGAGNAHANGTEELNAVMYVESAAGQNSIALKSIFESQASEKLGVGNEVEADGMTGTFIPDNMEAAAIYLEQDWYTNTLDVQVGEDGVLTIGVKKSQTMTNDWTIFTNWTLQYLGTEAPVAVEGIETQKAGVAAIYSIDGRQQNQLRRGINIIRNNGKVQKVLVK